MVYDRVHALADEIQNSEEYREYKKAKDAVFGNETNAAVMKEYKKLSIEAQAYVLAGKEPEQELADKLQKLYAVIQLSPECMNYLMNDYKLQMMMNEIIGILAKAADMDLGMPGTKEA